MTGFIGLIDRARRYILQFTISNTHTHTPKVTSSLPLFGSGLQPRNFAFLSDPELFPASTTSF
jgi:hypothetical protein